MESKKIKRVNLENKRGLFLLLGLVVAVGMVFLAFNFKKEITAFKTLDQPTNNPGTDFIDETPKVIEKKILCLNQL